MEFRVSGGKLVDIDLLKWEYADNVTFSRLEEFQDFAPFSNDLMKRRDLMRLNTNSSVGL